jgi:RNA polymerase sigma-70 factor (ECF subfamily)
MCREGYRTGEHLDPSSRDERRLANNYQGKALTPEEWTALLYSELRRLASYYMQQERGNHTLQATALVHEAYLRLIDQHGVQWKNRNQFLGVAATVMRRVLLDYSRGYQASKRGGNVERVFLEEAAIASKSRTADIVALDEALTKLSKVDPQQAHLVELRFFGGLSIAEAAEILAVSPATVKRNWNVAKAWLARELARGQDSHG